MLSVNRGGETYLIHDDGRVERPGIFGPSDTWRVTGAVERNNLRGVVRVYSLAEVLEHADTIPWRFKNGAQRVFIRDLDHGAVREWVSPKYTLRQATPVAGEEEGR